MLKRLNAPRASLAEIDALSTTQVLIGELNRIVLWFAAAAAGCIAAIAIGIYHPVQGAVAFTLSLACTGVAFAVSSHVRVRLRHLGATAVISMEHAKLDSLTHLPNRTYFIERLDAALESEPLLPVAVVYFDLDGFKEINDTLGHEFGDALLEAAADRMRNSAVAGEFVARLGGDEFAALVTGFDAGAGLVRFVEQVIAALEEPFSFNGSVFSVGASAGISMSSDDSRSRRELLRRADVAMYKAKANARGSYRIFSPDMDSELFVRRQVKTRLDHALTNGDLRLFYQPLYSGRTGALVGAEALVRWPNKDGGNLSPDQFIPVAEDSGQILQLGRWALETALERARAWENVPISVNVSPLQIRDHNFARMVGDCLVNSGVSPSMLKIEITEGVLISHADIAEQVIRQLHDLGVEVVLDDFGAGFSSLGYLRRFKFDTLKIDRSFAWDLKDNSAAVHLLRAIIDLSHGLNMTVVAEGIESERQAAVLKLLGCDYLQGYHLGVPMSADDFESRVINAKPVEDATAPSAMSAARV